MIETDNNLHRNLLLYDKPYVFFSEKDVRDVLKDVRCLTFLYELDLVIVINPETKIGEIIRDRYSGASRFIKGPELTKIILRAEGVKYV